MDRSTFEEHLKRATLAVVPFTRNFVTNDLPGEVRYLIRPNQSYDGNPLRLDEEVFPAESTADHPEPYVADAAAERLYRAGKVPEWINVTVESADQFFTYLQLVCCGRFTALGEMLYHRMEGWPPFHCLSPPLPPGWKSVEESGKFDLHWSQRKRRDA